MKKGMQTGVLLCILLSLAACSDETSTVEDNTSDIQAAAQVELTEKLNTFTNVCAQLRTTLKDDLATDAVLNYVPEELTATYTTLNAAEKQRLSGFEITDMQVGYDIAKNIYVCLYTFEDEAKGTSFLMTWYSENGTDFTQYSMTPMTKEATAGEYVVPIDDPQAQQPNFGWGMDNGEGSDYSFNEDTYDSGAYDFATQEVISGALENDNASDMRKDTHETLLTSEATSMSNIVETQEETEVAQVTDEGLKEVTMQAESGEQ